MKKSNALMLSYIIFLSITVVVKLIWKWDGLGQIALAASSAGLFFAFADLAGWYHSSSLPYAELFLEDVISLKENTITAANEKNEAKQNINEAIKLLKPYVDIKPKVADLIQICQGLFDSKEDQASQLARIANDFDELKSTSENYVRKIKRYRYVELILATLGFLVFFILTCFDDLVKWISPYEAVITVLAFVIIMLCYYLRDTVDEKVKREFEELKAEHETRKHELDDMTDLESSKEMLDSVKDLVERFKKSHLQKEVVN